MKFFRYLVHFLALPFALVAQGEPQLVSFDFRCLAMSEELRMKELYVGSPEDTKRLPIRLNDLSKTEAYVYTGSPLLYFYDEASGGSVVATYRYNPEQVAPLLLFVANEKGAMPAFSVLSIEDSWSKVGQGTCLLVNLTSKALYWKFGDERFKIPSKDQRLIDSQKEAKTPVIALEMDKNGNPHRVYRGQWHNVENMRRLIFVRDTTEKEVGSVRVKIIEDFYVPEAASVDEN
jgi:hypothetical protein